MQRTDWTTCGGMVQVYGQAKQLGNAKQQEAMEVVQKKAFSRIRMDRGRSFVGRQ